jgi:hypothetical protein
VPESNNYGVRVTVMVLESNTYGADLPEGEDVHHEDGHHRLPWCHSDVTVIPQRYKSATMVSERVRETKVCILYAFC